MSRIFIALQLYSVREDCAKDLPGVLEEVARMGYEGVEFAGFHGYDAKQIRVMLDDNGLKCAGTHIGLETLLGDQFASSVEFHQTLGNRFPIVPGLSGEYTSSKAGWLKAAGIFNELVDKLAPFGMRTGYHNHTIEFTPLEGELPWDTFFGHTKKGVVMQLDSGNARHAGVDISPFIEHYPGRAVTVHLKEWTDDPKGAIICEGKVPWEKIFRLCESVGGTEWYIVEQEIYPLPPMECARRCLENLRRMGK